MHKKRSGFTLVEIMVVVVIIGLLATVVAVNV
ncbi:MAG: prepilin-type N-terminal cleavage/methylation domain-containing protein, partial [Synergistaceae bacterium]|nr:prepilin-type N-terminal cleavage/methylation domain-containing protein [Synergistaceae bacterium]